MKLTYKIFIGISIVILVFVIFNKYKDVVNNKVTVDIDKQVVIGNNTFYVETVDSKDERRKGLSGIDFLNEEYGMLFVFEESGIYPFWMKDMNFPIDILWINKNMKIVYLVQEISPNTFPESFAPDKESMYVLEIASGEARKRNINVGEDVVFKEI